MPLMDLPLKQVKTLVSSAAGSLIKNEMVLGVDIGSASAKIVEVKKDDDGALELQSYGSIALPPEHEPRDGELQKGSRAAAVIELLSRIHAKGQKAGFSLPNSAAIVASFETVKRDADQMDKILPTEAQRIIAVSLDDVNLEWHEVGIPPTPTPVPMVKILLIAMRKEAREEAERIVKHASLSPLFFEVEMFAAARAAGAHGGETVLLIDFGASSTKAYVRNEKGAPLSAYSFDGGGAFSNRIAKESNISVMVAEAAKKEKGIKTDSPYYGVLSDMIGKILWESLRTGNELLGATGKKIERAILLGGGARMPGLPEFAGRTLGVPVDIATPFSNIRAPLVLTDTLKQVDPNYTVAVGLAMRALK
jgi:type IV pilus assembly protein PilM